LGRMHLVLGGHLTMPGHCRCGRQSAGSCRVRKGENQARVRWRIAEDLSGVLPASRAVARLLCRLPCQAHLVTLACAASTVAA
jgi:hypothetical protein